MFSTNTILILKNTPSAVTTKWSKTITIARDTNIDYNESSAVIEKYKTVINRHILKQQVTKPTCQGFKMIDHISCTLQTEKIFLADVLPTWFLTLVVMTHHILYLTH